MASDQGIEYVGFEDLEPHKEVQKIVSDHGTKAFGCADLEFHQEAQARFAGLGLINQGRVLAGKKFAIGAEQRAGWSGKLPFYLFKCENEKCGRIAKDYPHGHIHRQYLLCSACGAHHDFVPLRAELMMLWDSLRFAWRARNFRGQK